MIKRMFMILSVFILAGQLKSADAAVEKKKINVDAANVVKASKIMQQNNSLMKDPEMMKRLVRLSQSLKRK